MSKGYIYKTTNVLNNKIYIGKHIGEKNNNYFGSGKIIKKALNKYGKSYFKLEILVYTNNEKDLNELEKYYIAKYKQIVGANKLYNIANGGEGGDTWSITKRRQTEEAKNKIRVSLTGRKRPEMSGDKNPAKRPEVREKNRLSHLGKKASIDTRIKMSKSRKGLKYKSRTAEHILNLSLALKGRKAWNKNLTKETDTRLISCGNRSNHRKKIND